MLLSMGIVSSGAQAPRRVGGACASALALATLATPARAQVTIHVADETELATAITTANADSANPYEILLDADIELTTALPDVTSELTIRPNPSEPAGDLIHRSTAGATQAFRLFRVGANGDEKGNLTLEDLTLENGLLQNAGVTRGGGIQVADNGALDVNRTRLLVRRVTFRGNQALGQDGSCCSAGSNGLGGAIYGGADSFVTIEDCSFEDNLARGGSLSGFNSAGSGEGRAVALALDGPIVLTDLDATDNVASGTGSPTEGGAIRFTGTPTVTATRLRLISNSATTRAGAIRLQGTVDLTESCIVGNSDVALFDPGGGTFTANDNWWGSDTGPGPPGGTGLGDTITTTVGVSSFLSAPPVGLWCPSVGPEIAVLDGSDQDVPAGGAVVFASSTTQGVPVVETITVRNDGVDTLTLLTDPPDTTGGFSASSFASVSLSPAGAGTDATTFDVTCPTALVGTHLGSVSFANDDADENPFSFDVSCTVVGSGSIGDRVWHDLNGDGEQDAGEPGLADVVVYLDLDEDGVVDAGEPSQVTDSVGAYDLTELAAGSYSVRVDSGTLPAGLVLSTGNLPLPVTLAVAEDFDTADFGYGPAPIFSDGFESGDTVSWSTTVP